MARKRAWIFVPMLLAGCSVPDARDARPGTLAIDRIERELAGRSCFGALDGWERHYSFGQGGDHRSPDHGVERDRITWSYVQAGVYGFRPGRVLENTYEGLGTDERQMRFAFGDYYVSSGTLVVYSCGWNTDPQGRGAPVPT
jgi:hypothetical protein